MPRSIQPNAEYRSLVLSDKDLNSCTFSDLSSNYEKYVRIFHQSLPEALRRAQEENALYHKRRYLLLLDRHWTGNVLDVGNDKPFLSYFLRKFNPDSNFITISYEIPDSIHELFEVDIEKEAFPLEDSSIDTVIFTEVIEHLWRNPSFCIHQISRVMKPGGSLYLTTPNPCDLHSLICILWQANPNQRSQYYASLESGHIHLWTCGDIKCILEAHGFEKINISTANLYGHTQVTEKIEDMVKAISPHRALMNEAVVAEARKSFTPDYPVYPREIYPDGVPVQRTGAIKSFMAD